MMNIREIRTGVAEVQAGKENQRLKAQHAYWSGEYDCDDVIEISLFELKRCGNGFVASLFTEALSAAFENRGTISVIHQQEI